MAAHTAEQREFIVRRLAEYFTSREIADQFRARWPETDCKDADVLANDPRAAVLPPELFDTFNMARRNFDAALEAEWPDLSAATRVAAIGLQRDIEWCRNRGAIEQAMKSTAELAKVLNGFYVGKNAAAAQVASNAEPVQEIRVTIVDPAKPAGE